VIEAVIFDWGGTLTPWVTADHLAGWRRVADVLHDGDPERAAVMADALLAAEDARWRTVRDEHRAFTLAQVLADAAEHHPAAVTPELVEAAFEAFRAYWTGLTPLHRQAAPTLTALRERGLRLGVLSTTTWPRAWHEEALRGEGVLELFDGCVWTPVSERQRANNWTQRVL
jgi:FMN hydrolase / 5-amino-6-(5-phospho-D-ribitylamino)uracil phosphatase